MIDSNKLIDFLLRSRTKTYVGNGGKVEPLLVGSRQLEYSENGWLYRDIYNIGNGKFVGLETVYSENIPIYSMSYYGNFEKMSETEVDKILRRALNDKWKEARLWNHLRYKIDGYTYLNKGSGGIEEFVGTEKIQKNRIELYFFYYAGGLVG